MKFLKKSRTQKTFFSLFLVAIVAIVFSSCQSTPTVPSVTGNTTWYFFDPVIEESEVLTLDDEGCFIYHCQCGEPIGDSDLYDQYKYDNENQKIIAFADNEDSQLEFDVISITPYNLILRDGGKIKVFTPTYINDDLSYFGGDKYISGYSGYFTIKGLKNNLLSTAPFDYDGDVSYEDSAFADYTLVDGAKLYQLDITSTYKTTDPDQDIDYKEISSQEASKLFADNSSVAAFLWFNDNMEVEKVVFFGQTINWI